MRYYKVMNGDTLVSIGTDDNTGTEITKDEYDSLHEYILQQALMDSEPEPQQEE